MAKRKRTNNDLQSTTQKTKDKATQTPITTELRRPFLKNNPSLNTTHVVTFLNFTVSI